MSRRDAALELIRPLLQHALQEDNHHQPLQLQEVPRMNTRGPHLNQTPPRRDTVGDVLLWAMLASLAGFLILFVVSVFNVFILTR